ncbi:CRISPR-associated helicase Cas3, subtype CYANO [Allochromatium warmingii]|uniref:CRISPR-associated helicase Cas3, subtype CYANO n=1 Tax=Allochromatium warmingii TaxID=61595 RepID=A0A1H3J0Y1_ALLWA|nr:DEAD/DEAH box helicase [Allochromatium warmingii]SDY33673.1 CRISPR-associated helicase Cas3, subtype CYANO [Allochromatium warmingii]
MELTIAKHCVAKGDDGLSPLQRALLDNAQRIRIAEAPTGAGKSYAFQRALHDRGERVLFIVPTRRLAQNLASGLVQDLIASGWSEERARSVVALWSSDQTADLKAQGIVHINGLRLRQMQALKLGSHDGEMIVAVPEVVSALLVLRRIESGQAGDGVFDLLADFDHIVFDEFHTIEARGFGLAALFARLATAGHESSSGYGRAKLSFLSATPLDLLSTLERVGVTPDQVAVLREELVDDGRPLHGDVVLSVRDALSLRDLIQEHIEDIRAEINANRQVVVIYDSLAALEKDLPFLARSFPASGINPTRVLVVNSVRDSIAQGLHDAGFAIGRKCDPLAYDLILATASVEMGVTFRKANLMLMEPGFEPMNFLQRYGRAARRGDDGRVIVRLEAARIDRDPWLRTLRDWVQAHIGQQLSIKDLTDVLSQAAVASNPRAMAAGTFGQLSGQAAWCAGLYWNLLMDHASNRGHRSEHLFQHRPATAKGLYRLEQAVKRLADDPHLEPYVAQWLRLFRAQALDLRTIERKIRVVNERGEGFDYPEVWLKRETTVYERFPLIEDEIRIQGSVDDYWRDEPDRNAKRRWICHFPHTSETCTLPYDSRLVDAWCREIENVDHYAVDWEEQSEALEAAKKLVRLTGLVPGHDPNIPVDAVSVIL